MRVLTTVATFILPLRLVTGWFGMNFRHVAGLEIEDPDPLVLGSFGVVTIFMALMLRRGWM